MVTAAAGTITTHLDVETTIPVSGVLTMLAAHVVVEPMILQHIPSVLPKVDTANAMELSLTVQELMVSQTLAEQQPLLKDQARALTDNLVILFQELSRPASVALQKPLLSNAPTAEVLTPMVTAAAGTITTHQDVETMIPVSGAQMMLAAHVVVELVHAAMT